MVPCCGTPILPYLYLGDESDASDPDKLKSQNIYYVLNVTADLPGEGENASIRYKRIPARDSFDQNLVQYFEESFQFIEEARKAGCAVLIHCHAGISRSPTIVVAYLMYSQRMTFNNAYKFVESKRPIISPNFSFVGQLYEYGKTQLKTSLTPNSSTSISTTPTNCNPSIPSSPSSVPVTVTSIATTTIPSISLPLPVSSSKTITTMTSSTGSLSSTSTSSSSSSSSCISSSLLFVTSTLSTTTITTSISAPTTPTSPMPLLPPMPTTPISTTMPTLPTIPTSRSYLKISDTLNKQPFFLQPPPPPLNSSNSNSLKDGLVKSDVLPSSCEALSDIPYNSLGPVRGCRSRKSCNNDFILLRPIKMTKNTRVK